METSILIAKLLAVVYVFVGLGMIINPKYYSTTINDMIKNPLMFYFGGIMATVAGVLMITYHNIWEYSWVGVITLFGWIALVKGFMLFVFPTHVKFWQSFFKKCNCMSIYGVVVTAAGLFFGYFGFVA
ncbi:hypothetical protein KKG71_06845 [Patescibacteria group bacterium]|nr:hypothetical protein [Patescibacteria group bacterium]